MKLMTGNNVFTVSVIV